MTHMGTTLSHHGIKGQKWGVRRFRDYNGSLTEAGKNRYYKDDGKPSDEGKRLKRNTENANKAVSGAKQVVSGAKQIRSASENRARNRYNKRENLSQEELDKMSDDDLRKLVNRLNLEQQYSTLTEDRTSRSKIDVGLSYADAALSIVGGALSIAAAYKMLRG